MGYCHMCGKSEYSNDDCFLGECSCCEKMICEECTYETYIGAPVADTDRSICMECKELISQMIKDGDAQGLLDTIKKLELF
jgi:hypothetical protein